MKRLLFLLLLTVALGGVASAQLQHMIKLNNGSVLRGNLVETDNTEQVKIKTNDGALHVLGLNEVETINNLSRRERNRYSIFRPYGIFIRPEFGLGMTSVATPGYSVGLSMGFQFCPYYVLYGGAMMDATIPFTPIEYSSKNFIVGNRVYIGVRKYCMYLDLFMSFGQIVKHIEEYSWHESNNHSTNYIQKEILGGIGLGAALGPMDVGAVVRGTIGGMEAGTLMLVMSYNFRKGL